MSLPYRLGSSSLFVRSNEDTIEPKRVVFLSAEGTLTEVNYFKYIERYRTQLGIDAIVHIEILRKHDTNSDPDNVLALLEEYVNFRDSEMFEKEISSLNDLLIFALPSVPGSLLQASFSGKSAVGSTSTGAYTVLNL